MFTITCKKQHKQMPMAVMKCNRVIYHNLQYATRMEHVGHTVTNLTLTSHSRELEQHKVLRPGYISRKYDSVPGRGQRLFSYSKQSRLAVGPQQATCPI